MTKTLSDPVSAPLTYLLHLVAREGGFEYRGRRGWALPDHVQEHTRRWGTGEVLRMQARRGRVLQHDVRVPGTRQPTYIYRLTQKGLDHLAESAGIAPARVLPPDLSTDLRVYLRDGVASALLGLRQAAEAAAGLRAKEWVPGETGWRSALEISRAWAEEAERTGVREPYFVTDDMKSLVRHGYAEHRIVGRDHIYRLTPAGAALRALDWKEPV
jgi:DNA-binding PadR family transcriptional regulator